MTEASEPNGISFSSPQKTLLCVSCARANVNCMAHLEQLPDKGSPCCQRGEEEEEEAGRIHSAAEWVHMGRLGGRAEVGCSRSSFREKGRHDMTRRHSGPRLPEKL